MKLVSGTVASPSAGIGAIEGMTDSLLGMAEHEQGWGTPVGEVHGSRDERNGHGVA
jgi:hypothetical protein